MEDEGCSKPTNWSNEFLHKNHIYQKLNHRGALLKKKQKLDKIYERILSRTGLRKEEMSAWKMFDSDFITGFHRLGAGLRALSCGRPLPSLLTPAFYCFMSCWWKPQGHTLGWKGVNQLGELSVFDYFLPPTLTIEFFQIVAFT